MNNKLKEEALLRMEYLNLSKQCIQAFKDDGKVWESEGAGILYEVNDEEQDMIDAFEHSHKDYKVFHMIHSIFNICGEMMEMYSMLCVSPYEEEWNYEKEDYNHGIAFCYVYNKTAPELSEFGSISIQKINGGLRRKF